jgi:glycosyltransferase involved in cell wall biosynthesis
VRVLGMRAGIPDPLGVQRLACWLQQDPPHLIQTWMYHADLIGGLAAKLAGGIPVAWNIRHSDFDAKDNKRSTYWTIRACARFSRWLPARIICCSESSRQVHTALGYTADKMVVIPNGFDLTIFRPDPGARISVRQELGISGDAVIIGMVGRFNAQKDHYTFIRAAARLHALSPEVHFLLCGDGVTPENSQLDEWINTHGIANCFHLLGQREDIPRLNAALDIGTMTSAHGEGFPNVIGEAMACGVPCVVTDVGDSASIVGDTGRVVPPKNPQALVNAWRELIEMGPHGRSLLGAAGRRRVGEHFGLKAITAKYQELYEEIAFNTF